MEETEDSCSRVSKRSGTIVETLGDPITCYCREPLLTLMSQLTKHVDDQGLEDTSNLNTGCFVAMALFPLLVGRWGDGVPVLFGHRSEDADVETNGRAFVIASDHINPEVLLLVLWLYVLLQHDLGQGGEAGTMKHGHDRVFRKSAPKFERLAQSRER